MQNKVKNEINCYSFELMIIFILSCWDFASAPICKKKCCSVLTTRIYKFHRVPIKARSKELEKKKGRKEGREGARVFYLHRAEQTRIPVA